MSRRPAVTEEARELLGSAALQHDRAQLAIVATLAGCELLDAEARAGTVRARCAHEVAGTVLEDLRAVGPPVWHPQVDELLRALPLRGACGRGGDRWE